MPYGIKITIDKVTRTENCNMDVCLKESVNALGAIGAAAGMLGVEESDIKKVEITGMCEGCKLEPFLKRKES